MIGQLANHGLRAIGYWHQTPAGSMDSQRIQGSTSGSSWGHCTSTPIPGGPTEEIDDRKRQSSGDKRAAKKRCAQAEREEMQKWKAGRAAENTHKGSDKGKGRGKSKDQSNQEICYSWANGKGPNLWRCWSWRCRKSKIKRVHKCQYCLSPAHRNRDCEASWREPSKKVPERESVWGRGQGEFGVAEFDLVC